MKARLRPLWLVESHVRGLISLSRWFYRRVPVIGRAVSLVIDRLMLTIFGLDVTSHSIAVRRLSISHPNGVLLGGNGVVSAGRVAIMAGVKFVGRSPSNAGYVAAAQAGRTFVFGDNVVIGVNSVIVGPVDICDNVVIGTMSLVNRSISEPGTYVGIPVRKISDEASDEWVAHL